jgi:hypothetical protein
LNDPWNPDRAKRIRINDGVMVVRKSRLEFLSCGFEKDPSHRRFFGPFANGPDQNQNRACVVG